MWGLFLLQNIHIMKRVTDLLLNIRSVSDKIHQTEERAKTRGERFNIFSILGVNHYELAHSTIIAEFLNPDGSHGQGDIFLDEFLNEIFYSVSCRFRKPWVMKSGAPFDISSAKVYTEYDTGNGRIDILIRNEAGQAVIIENKLYAADQPEQLKRYAEFAERQNWDYSIVYLTLYGDEASTQSAEGIDYVRISYSDEIIKWLQRCICNTVDKPFLRETFIQYSNLVKKLTHRNMETKFTEEVIKAMVDNAEAAAMICSMQQKYREYVQDNILLPKLKEFADESGLQFAYDWEMNGEKGFYFRKKEWKNAAIWFYSENRTSWSGFYITIMNEYPDVPLTTNRQVQLHCFDGNCSDSYPFGWKYMEQGYSEWDMDTLADIVNGKFIEYVKEQTLAVINELEENSCFQKG